MMVVKGFVCPKEAAKEAYRAVKLVHSNLTDPFLKQYASSVSYKIKKPPLIVFDIDDTLVTETGRIDSMIELLQAFHKLSATICLVTARHPSMRNETIQELHDKGIQAHMYEDISFSPENYRKSMKLVGDWKAKRRYELANKHKTPVLLTAGDQWTDLIRVDSVDDLQLLDDAFGTSHNPFLLVRPSDGISILGLKLT